jgi:2-oxoglutarate ferredoxin oxidoreductase subunit beta
MIADNIKRIEEKILSKCISIGRDRSEITLIGVTKTQPVEIIKQAISHSGFSLVNILQPCVTFNKVNTYQYYLKRVYKLDDNYDKTDFKLALEKTLELNEEKFPLGVIYQIEKKSYHEQLPQLSDDLTLISKKRFEKINDLIKNFQ